MAKYLKKGRVCAMCLGASVFVMFVAFNFTTMFHYYDNFQMHSHGSGYRNYKVTGNVSEMQPTSMLRLHLVPPGLNQTVWESILDEIGLNTESLLTERPEETTLSPEPCEYASCPQVVLTVLNRWGDLHVALLSLRSYSKVSVVLVDSQFSVPNDLMKSFPSVEWLQAQKPHLASAWNIAFETHPSEKYLLVCNEDVIFPANWLDRLQLALERHAQAAWIGMTQSIQFSGFLLPSATWRRVGPFDDVFRAYYEDDDYLARIEECFGPDPSHTPVLIPKLKPVVIHRRTGWHFSEDQNARMATIKAESFAYFHEKWQVALKSSQCQENCCVKTRQNHLVFRRSKMQIDPACPVSKSKNPCRSTPTRAIVDAFLFQNEISILEARLKSLYDLVDHFVLVESNVTFSGDPSPLYFQQNINRFKHWLPKIKYYSFLMDVKGNSCDREKAQRNFLLDGVREIGLKANDIILLTDVDEIPDLNSGLVGNFIQRWDSRGYVCLGMDAYYFQSQCKGVDRWNSGRLLTMNALEAHADIDKLRREACNTTIYPSGWHLSYFGGANEVKEKLRSFSHSGKKAFMADDPDLENCLKNCTDFLHTPMKSMQIVARIDNPYPPLIIA